MFVWILDSSIRRKAWNPDRPLFLVAAGVLTFRVSNKQLKRFPFMFSWKSLTILCRIGDCLPSEGSKRGLFCSNQWQQCCGVSGTCSHLVFLLSSFRMMSIQWWQFWSIAWSIILLISPSTYPYIHHLDINIIDHVYRPPTLQLSVLAIENSI